MCVPEEIESNYLATHYLSPLIPQRIHFRDYFFAPHFPRVENVQNGAIAKHLTFYRDSSEARNSETRASAKLKPSHSRHVSVFTETQNTQIHSIMAEHPSFTLAALCESIRDINKAIGH